MGGYFGYGRNNRCRILDIIPTNKGQLLLAKEWRFRSTGASSWLVLPWRGREPLTRGRGVGCSWGSVSKLTTRTFIIQANCRAFCNSVKNQGLVCKFYQNKNLGLLIQHCLRRCSPFHIQKFSPFLFLSSSLFLIFPVPFLPNFLDFRSAIGRSAPYGAHQSHQVISPTCMCSK